MSYLRFDKTLMINLEESLPREILRTNKSGAYHCTTIVDCNTRKYHGLLVIPVPNLDDENHVLLSSLDETVIQHGAEFNLGLHKYQGNHFSPNGHKYIREFDCEYIPATTYRVGGVILRKEKIFVHHENRILIRYTLVDAHSATTLRFRPFLAFRSVREYTHENSQASRDYQLVENGIKTCMYPGYPELFMQLNKKNEFHFQPDWYRGIEYPKEQERGYDFNEDLYVPGYFEVDIKKGESIVFSAGISETDTRKLKQVFETEVADRTPRDSFFHCLKNSAHQFHNKQGGERCRQMYGQLLEDLLEYIRGRKHDNLFLHDNGLLYTNGTEHPVTWMNSTANGRPVVPRTGYVVEINALWYNALRFVADMVREGGNEALANVLDEQAELTGKSFVEVFRNEYGYLFDYVDGYMMDWSVRPNMIFTVAFDYSPLDRVQKRQVLDIVTKELLTPKGLRTLSPKSGGYNPNYVGPQMQRDYAYHQGTAWPWLLGFYMEAYLRVYKLSGISFVERHLIGMDDEMGRHCISTLPELFDGNPPFVGRGAISFAMNVAEILRILSLLYKYEQIQKEEERK